MVVVRITHCTRTHMPPTLVLNAEVLAEIADQVAKRLRTEFVEKIDAEQGERRQAVSQMLALIKDNHQRNLDRQTELASLSKVAQASIEERFEVQLNLFRFEQTNLLNDLHHKHTETANSLQTSLESVVTGLSEQRLILVALQQQAESLRSELSQSNSTIDAMQTRIDQHAAKLTAFESSIGSLQAAVPELQQSQSAQHQAVVDSIERQVNVLSETCKNRCLLIEEQTLRSRTEEAESLLSSLELLRLESDRRDNALTAQCSELQSQMGDVERRSRESVEALQTSLDSISAPIQESTVSIGDLKAQHSALSSKLDALYEAVESLTSQTYDLARTTPRRERVNEIDHKWTQLLDSLAEKMVSLQSDVQRVRSDVKKLSNRALSPFVSPSQEMLKATSVPSLGVVPLVSLAKSPSASASLASISVRGSEPAAPHDLAAQF